MEEYLHFVVLYRTTNFTAILKTGNRGILLIISAYSAAALVRGRHVLLINIIFAITGGIIQYRTWIRLYFELKGTVGRENAFSRAT